MWWQSLTRFTLETGPNSLIQASDLYIGNYWSLVQKLTVEAARQGLEPNLWIISAGYGLISATDRVIPYSATFTRRDADSVTGKPTETNPSEAWWNELTHLNLLDSDNPRSLEGLIGTYSKDYFLVVASSEYLNAIQSDLVRGLHILEKQGELVLISSKTAQISEELTPNYISTDARLLCGPNCVTECNIHLLGRNVRTSIGVSLAKTLLGNLRINGGFSAASFRKEVMNAVKKSPELFVHKRIPMSDLEVKSFVQRELTAMPSVSATQLLKKLRSQGRACEQKRFRELYLEVKQESK